MKKRITVILLLLVGVTVGAQQRQWRLGDIVPDSVAMPTTLQGLGVSGDYAFVMRNRGQCVVIDLKHSRFVGQYHLSHCTGHCNNLSFSAHKDIPLNIEGCPPALHQPFPQAYISTTFGDKSCYVTWLFPNHDTYRFSIFYDSDCFPVAQDWCVDAENNEIYAYGGRWGETLYLKRFAMPWPKPGQKEVHLTDKDVLQTIPIDCVKAAQGSKIYNGYAFLPDGLEPGQFWLHVVDLKNGKEVARLDLNSVGLEPEGIDIQGRWLYLSFWSPNAADNLIVRYKLRKVLASKPQ